MTHQLSWWRGRTANKLLSGKAYSIQNLSQHMIGRWIDKRHWSWRLSCAYITSKIIISNPHELTVEILAQTTLKWVLSRVFFRSRLCSPLKEWLRCSTFHKKHLSFHLRCTPWQSEGHSAWTQLRLGTSMYCEQKNCVGSNSTTWYHLETSSGAYFVHKDSEIYLWRF